MENTEIMVNEETIETVEEITTETCNNGLKYAVVAAAAVGVGCLIYKKVVKPMIAKHKAKKAEAEAQDFEDEE